MEPHGTTNSEVDNPSSAGLAEEGWIYVRGVRIEKAGLRIDSHGNVYVPDSEDEESGMEDKTCGLDVTAGTDVAMDLTTKVHDEAEVRAVGAEMALDVAADDGMKVPTEVPEQLKEVLADMDPIYHGVFVNMYKILVPICFRSFHR